MKKTRVVNLNEYIEGHAKKGIAVGLVGIVFHFEVAVLMQYKVIPLQVWIVYDGIVYWG